jgi:leucine dehydrogenase
MTSGIPDYEELSNIALGADGARAVIAIHSTRMGPAAGGFRLRPGRDQDKAVSDALRMSQRVAYRNALIGLPYGGGQAVVLLSAGSKDSVLREFSRAVDELGGRYRFMEDQGSHAADLHPTPSRYLRGRGFARARVGMDIARCAASSAFLSIQAALRWWMGKDLNGSTIAVDGAGPMAGELCRQLAGAGARIIVSDPNPDHARILAYTVGARVARADDIHRVGADVFAPCTLGRTLDLQRAMECRAAIVCGALEDQLADPAAGAALHANGILYCPDYIASAGGAIGVHCRDIADISKRIGVIPWRLLSILERAAQDLMQPELAAEKMALAHLAGSASAATSLEMVP